MPPATRLRLTERDHELLDALGDHRFLSVPQAAALFFRSTQSAARRLRELTLAKLAVPVFMPVRPYARESTTVYALSARGATLLTPRHNGLRPRHLTSREQRSGLFLDHTLRRNDVRIALELLQESRKDFSLLAWQQNPDQVRSSAIVKIGTRNEARVTIVPDGVALVRVGGECQVLAVEIDMGTVPIPRMWKRYRAYWKWWRVGGTRVRYGPAPYRVLTLANSVKRRDALRQASVRAPERGNDGSRLFWHATLDAADLNAPERILGSVWHLATGKPSAPVPLFSSPSSFESPQLTSL